MLDEREGATWISGRTVHDATFDSTLELSGNSLRSPSDVEGEAV